MFEPERRQAVDVFGFDVIARDNELVRGQAPCPLTRPENRGEDDAGRGDAPDLGNRGFIQGQRENGPAGGLSADGRRT